MLFSAVAVFIFLGNGIRKVSGTAGTRSYFIVHTSYFVLTLLNTEYFAGRKIVTTFAVD
jgi:hypothetical protein